MKHFRCVRVENENQQVEKKKRRVMNRSMKLNETLQQVIYDAGCKY